MTIQQKFKYVYPGNSRFIESEIRETEEYIEDGYGRYGDYFFQVGSAGYYALKCYVEGDYSKAKLFAKTTTTAAVRYFHGDWRNRLPTPNGTVDPLFWRKRLWYDEVVISLPLAAALHDWKSVKSIAEYPPEDTLPEAKKAKGETAWVWALITWIRGEPLEKVEQFLAKAEKDKAKRPRFLCPILRAILAGDNASYSESFLAYLDFYQKHELRHIMTKLVSLDGTLLFHLALKQGLHVDLPTEAGLHVIQFS